MKFNLIIDKDCEESVTATVRERSALISEIEALVMAHCGTDKITAYTEDEMHTLTFSEIECIFVENKRTFAVARNGGRYRIKQRLYEIERLLPSGFIRLNKSAIGNLDQIEKFTSTLTGAVDAVFFSGHKEYVSRRCFADIKRRLAK